MSLKVRNNFWNQRTDFESVCRRASGRRRYNAVRHLDMLMRRQETAELALRLGRGFFGRGARAEIARRLGVHRSTISRDVKALVTKAVAARQCPLCGTALT
jgi:hypothetical protein